MLIVFLVTASLIVVRLYHTVVWIHVSVIIVMLSTFSCTCWASVYRLWKNVYSDPLPIFLIELFGREVAFVLVLSCMSLYIILDINSLSEIWLTNIFSHSVGCIFILLFPLLRRSDFTSLVMWTFHPNDVLTVKWRSYSRSFIFNLPFKISNT